MTRVAVVSFLAVSDQTDVGPRGKVFETGRDGKITKTTDSPNSMSDLKRVSTSALAYFYLAGQNRRSFEKKKKTDAHAYTPNDAPVERKRAVCIVSENGHTRLSAVRHRRRRTRM